MTATPAGWYPDPQDPALQRYWDGQAWTDSTAPAAPAAPPASSPAGAPDPAGPPAYDPSGGYPSYPSYSGFPAGQQGMPNPYADEKPSNTLSIIGIVCGGIGFLVCPIILGIAGLVLGFVARSKKEPLANVALIVSAIGLVGGLILGAVAYNRMGM